MKKLFFITTILFLAEITIAGSITTPKTSPYGFIENKGQIIDQNNNLNPAVKYLFNGNGLNVQLRVNGFSYDTYRRAAGSQLLAIGLKMPEAKSQEPIADSIFFHRIDIEFINANKNPQIISEQPSSDYTNYYTTGTPEEGVTNVRTFQKVTYKNIYNGIDLEFSTPPNLPKGEGLATTQGNSPLLWRGAGGEVEYNFIIHPNANVSQIRWKYNGAFSTTLTDGKIILQLAQGNLEEKIPESFLQESNEKVNVNYISFGENEFGFSASSFNKNKTLVIDPVPWATYYGGSGIDIGYGITKDKNGNILTCGNTTSNTNIATSGAYLAYYTSTQDAYITKFTINSSILWATYFGNTSGNCSGFAICTDTTGNVFITGNTYSTSGIATSGAYQTTIGGSSDVFVVKFTFTGALLWGTYFGGNNADNGISITSDLNGNVLITGNTLSTTGIATSGAYQTSFAGPTGGTDGDCFIAKFNSSGTIQWATYYGGSYNDKGNGICSDTSGGVFITGTTGSSSGIATSGTFQTSPGGTFIARFNSTGTMQWGTYFGGACGGYAISRDPFGNIYISGYVSGSGITATSGAYQTSFGGGTSTDAYLAKFNSTGTSCLWATYYGGSAEDRGYGVMTDISGNVYLSGLSSSTSGISSSGAYQTSFGGGGSDAFLSKFNSTGTRLWGTYFGANLGSWAYGIATDASGDIFITGVTGDTVSTATSGAFQTTRGGMIDAFIAAFTPSGGLPVQLISFDVKLEENKNVLCTWATASEVNNDFFEVQRSMHNAPSTEHEWQVVGKVKGNGTTNVKNDYLFTDNLLSIQHQVSSIYYRLRQVDFDGKFEYSNVVSVTLDKTNQNEIVVSPNPTSNELHVSTNPTSNMNLQLFDITGKQIGNNISFTNSTSINTQYFSEGIYFLRITNENSGEVKMQKAVVMK